MFNGLAQLLVTQLEGVQISSATPKFARVVELAYTLVLETSYGGSNPSARIKLERWENGNPLVCKTGRPCG